MSQLDSTVVDIDGKKFEIFKLDPMTSLDLVIDLTNTLAPAVGAAVNGLQGEEAIGKLLNDRFAELGAGDVVERLMGAITKDRMRSVIAPFRKVTHIDGKELDRVFDIVFRGNLSLMIKWLAACFKAEWGNELAAVQSAIGRALATAGLQSSSQDNSSDDGLSTGLQ